MPGELGEISPLDPNFPQEGRVAEQLVRSGRDSWLVHIELDEPMGPHGLLLSFKINVFGPHGGYRSIDLANPMYADDQRYQNLAIYIQQCFNSGNTLTPQEAQNIARMAGFSQVGVSQQRGTGR